MTTPGDWLASVTLDIQHTKCILVWRVVNQECLQIFYEQGVETKTNALKVDTSVLHQHWHMWIASTLMVVIIVKSPQVGLILKKTTSSEMRVAPWKPALDVRDCPHLYRVFFGFYNFQNKRGGQLLYWRRQKTPDLGVAGFPKSVLFEVSPVSRKGA